MIIGIKIIATIIIPIWSIWMLLGFISVGFMISWSIADKHFEKSNIPILLLMPLLGAVGFYQIIKIIRSEK